MLTRRIIPCLDVKNGRTVKGTHFLRLRDAGDPVELAARYADAGADELVFLDITATIEERSTFLELVDRIAAAIQIPFTVGGGIASVDDVLRALDAGADKVSLNSAILRDPSLLERCAARVGSQSIVAAIDARRTGSSWTVWTKSGTAATGRDVVAWAVEATHFGAGEILLTSMDRDGTTSGYDLELLRAVGQAVRVPVVASGGAGTTDHIAAALLEGGADAVLAASVFHFGTILIPELKRDLASRGIPIRL
ncbi:MAG: imidazole glycerol phosphate synthase subunit HisF [Bacteroidota bacterium]